MWIDTHCHLDAPEFNGQGKQIAEEAEKLGLSQIVIPSVEYANFSRVITLAQTCRITSYALGIHPMYVPASDEADLAALDNLLKNNIADPKLVAVGEIGLDFYIPELAVSPLREKQIYFLTAQLEMAQKYGLPVLLHTRRSVDVVLKYLRQKNCRAGIAHAFSGSAQQAAAFINQGFKLSFCGTATYERAHQRRLHAATLPMASIVIETDAPDLPPAWKKKKENSPLELPRIGETIAALRHMPPEAFAKETSRNAIDALPRLKNLGSADL